MSYATETTLVTTGVLPALLLASAVLTAPASLLLLRLYRRAVVRGMAGQAGVATPAAPADALSASDPPPLDIELLDAAALHDTEVSRYTRAVDSLKRATVVYVLAGLAYALVLASPWLLFSEPGAVQLPRFLWLLSCYLWPAALAAGMLVAISPGQRALVGLAYFGMLLAVALYGVLHSTAVSAEDLATFWLITNAPATLLLLAFLHRRVRAVGPLVLAFMVTVVIGSQLLLTVFASSDAALRGAVSIGAWAGLGGVGVLTALLLLGLALFAIVGWWLLKRLGERYERRKMSDQSLTLDAMWLLFGMVQSIAFASGGWLWVFMTGLAGFAAYKVVAHVGFAMAGVARHDAVPPTLLLLRVFALGGKSEHVFDALSKRWLRAGPITLIAGPDLVASTVEPHEFLEFMAGRLSRRFVLGGEDLERRLGAVERGPDPDGRYRTNEFFCYSDTWQATMSRLAAHADAVLMDLRSFSPANQGCIFELQQLFDTVSLERVALLIDDTTDRAFLERVLGDSWRRMRAASPNRRLNAPELRLVRVTSRHAADITGLLRLLLAGPGIQPRTR